MHVVDYVSEARGKTAILKYGIGGQCVHRGVMCADPFCEIDSNIKRGNMTDKEPNRKNYYRYSFDDSSRLLLVEKFCDVDTIEVLCREGNIIYGLEFPVKSTDDLHAVDLTIYGNVINEGRVEASFYTSKTGLEAGLNASPLFVQSREVLIPHFWGTVIDYENGFPLRYYSSIRSKLCFSENEIVISQIVSYPPGYLLFLNDEGDVVKYKRIKKERCDDIEQDIRDLERPIPRKQWHDCHGLL